MTETFCPIGLIFWEKDGKTKICEFWQLWNEGLEINSRTDEEVANGRMTDHQLADKRYLSVIYSKELKNKEHIYPRSYLNNICDFIGEYLSQLRHSLHSDCEAEFQSDEEDDSPISCRRQHLLGTVFSRISSIEEVKDHLESDPSRSEEAYKWLINTKEQRANDEVNIDQLLLTQALINSDSSPRKQQFQQECAKEYFIPSHKSDKMYDYSKDMVGQLCNMNLLCDFLEKEMGLISIEEMSKNQVSMKRLQKELRSFREAIRSLSITLNRTLDALNQEIVSAYGREEKLEKRKSVDVEKVESSPVTLPRRFSVNTELHHSNGKSCTVGRKSTQEISAGKGRGSLRLSVSLAPTKEGQCEKSPHLSLELLRARDKDTNSVCSEKGRLSISDYSSGPGSPVGSISSAATTNTVERNYKKKYEALQEEVKTKDVMIRNLKNETKKYREEKLAAANELKILHGKLDGMNDGGKKKKKVGMGSLNENEAADMSEEEMYNMLQRLKKENKDLRKSRNTLQSDHLLLGKIEGKLRYKLEILMKKLNHFQTDMPNNFQKKMTSAVGSGSIEDTIDALMEHITWMSDRCVALENELKLKGGNGLKNLCQDLKQFALEHNLVEKSLKDEEWMPSYQKVSTDPEEPNSSWQTLFKHMSSTLQSDKDRRKEAMEWVQSNTTINYSKGATEEAFVDCFMCAIKDLQSDQTKMQSMKEKVENEKVKLEEELKELRNSLSKEEETKKEYRTQMDQMESQMSTLRKEKQEREDTLQLTKQQLEIAHEKTQIVTKECDTAMQVLRVENEKVKNDLKDVSQEKEKFKDEVRVMSSDNKTMEDALRNMTTERDELRGELLLLRQERDELKKEVGKAAMIVTTSIAIQTDPVDLNGMISEEFSMQMKCLADENAELLSEINRLIQEKSRLNDSTDAHKGEVLCMVTSPNEYLACTGGNDYTVRLWKPNSNKVPSFEPCACALVEGKILSLAITSDGRRIACGCSVRDTPNGYVVVWDVASREVLCNLRSRPTQRFGKVSAIAFGNDSWIFAGDITGQIYVYDVATQQQLAHVHGHKDVIHQLRILPNNVMISVSHDQWLGQFDLSQLNALSIQAPVKPSVLKKRPSESKRASLSLQPKSSEKNIAHANADIKHADIKHFQIEHLFKDEKYPLLTTDFFNSKHVITGSRKLILVPLAPKQKNDDEKSNSKTKQSDTECFGTDKDLDIIQHLSVYRDKYIMVHRNKLDYIKVLNADGSLACRCDIKQNNIVAIGYSHDGKYAIVCMSTKSLSAGSLLTFAIA